MLEHGGQWFLCCWEVPKCFSPLFDKLLHFVLVKLVELVIGFFGFLAIPFETMFDSSVIIRDYEWCCVGVIELCHLLYYELQKRSLEWMELEFIHGFIWFGVQ